MLQQEEYDRIAMTAEFQKEQHQGNLTRFERLLWWVALNNPGKVRIIWNKDQTDPYLLRVYLYRSEARGVYLHRFFRSDGDREVHNHPWTKAVSLVLTRGYLEHRWNAAKKTMDKIWVKPWSLNRIGRNDFHRVELNNGRVWTLFFSNERVAESDGYDWGFLDTDNGTYTPWGLYVTPTVQA